MGYGPGRAATKFYPLDTPAPLRGTDATAGLRITTRRAARLSVNYRVSTALGAPGLVPHQAALQSIPVCIHGKPRIAEPQRPVL